MYKKFKNENLIRCVKFKSRKCKYQCNLGYGASAIDQLLIETRMLLKTFGIAEEFLMQDNALLLLHYSAQPLCLYLKVKLMMPLVSKSIVTKFQI